jgi:F-type H+-transporting ATPase subunit epsilon
MGKPFTVDVVTPEAVIWTGEADFIAARTTEGEIGILADHEPTMGALSAGAVVINSTDGSTITVGVNGGFLQVFHNQVTLLTDRAEITEGGKEDALRLAQEMGPDETV